MSQAPKQRKNVPTLRELYPELNEEQLEEAEHNLDRYAAFLIRIAQRIAADSVAGNEDERLTQLENVDTKGP